MRGHGGAAMRPDVTDLTERLQRFLASAPSLAAFDARTLAFCRARLVEYAAALPTKLASEVGGRAHRPLGRVLIVVAEQDVMGTLAAVVAAHATGNRVRVKARTTRLLLAALAGALAIDDCEILDWDSRAQDDAAVLDGIDAVLLAGGDELIRYYRRVTPPGVRLVELGPKLSCAAIGAGAGDLDRLADALVDDVTLFEQEVCSSPQWILADDEAIVPHLRARLGSCPVLPAETRLLQHARGEALRMRARLGEAIAVEIDASTGWGLTVTRSLDDRLPKGFAIVLGVADRLAELARRHRHELQTLGIAGRVPEAAGFTHVCPIGRMHQRSPLAPHDGFFELASLVTFTSREVPV
jgi:hypothetical protein